MTPDNVLLLKTASILQNMKTQEILKLENFTT